MDLIVVPPNLRMRSARGIGHGKELFGLAHVPVKVLGLQAKRKHVRQDGSRDIPHSVLNACIG